jgi:tetratricopeptide (TPR) repeat protein
VAAEQVVADPAPGSGPPKGAWIPRYGLVLASVERPRPDKPETVDNPKTVEDLAKMLAASPGPCGARYQQRISDGYNPFGSSDYYMSIYRGWIKIPAAGQYTFCTASNEGSFSFIDGKQLVHWPGRHTARQGMYGEHKATVTLAAGLHYVEYYHEEVLLEQMAFLGWIPPNGKKDQFGGIDPKYYPPPHPAVVARYESTAGPVLRFEPTVTDSLWPATRHEGQYTRVVFRVTPPAAADPKAPVAPVYHWDFGDGQTAAGAQVEHLYLALGRYTVKASSEGAGGGATAEWPLEVYEIQNVNDQMKEGKLQDYVKLALGYDRAKLDEVALRELVHLLAESGHPDKAVEAGNEYLARFATAPADKLRGVRRVMAECAIQLGKGKVDEAISNYRASLGDDLPDAEKFQVLARLITLLGIERNLPDKTGEIIGQVDALAKKSRMDESTVAAYRACMIAAGDVLLWHAKHDDARAMYRRAEAITKVPIPRQVRSAKIGSYPNAIRAYIESGQYGPALDIVDTWEQTFPSEKLGGQTFFWRGKLLALRGQQEDAARFLTRSVALATGAGFESEARWLLAQALTQLNRPEDARRELARLVAAGFNDDFAKKAREQLAKAPATQPAAKEPKETKP